MAWMWARIRREERGAVLVIATVGVVLATIAASLAVDLGRLAAEKRTNQKVADMAALDAVRALPSSPVQPARDSAARNHFPVGTAGYLVQAVAGSVDAAGLFVQGSLPTANAVKVTVTSPLKNQFVPGDHTVTATAVAKLGSALGSVRVGSKLATAGGTVGPVETVVLNRLLNRVLGGSYTFDAVSWKGIADANVTFNNLRAALGLTAGSADQALDTTLTFRQILTATATALQADGSPSSAAVATYLATIGAQANLSGPIESPMELRDFFTIAGNVGNGQDVADATLNVLDILRGGVILADTDHFATMDVTATDAPGVFGTPTDFARVKFGLIEAPRTASGAPKDANGTYLTMAETSQVRVLIEFNLKLNLVGLGLVDVKVPYYLNAGEAEALLDTILCSGTATPSAVEILGRTKAGTSNLATTTDASLGNPSTPPTLDVAQLFNVTVPLIGNVTVSTTSVTTTNIPGNPGVMLTFSPPYTAEGPSQPVPGTQLTLPGLAEPNLTVGGTGVLSLLNIAALKADLALDFNAALPGLTTGIVGPIYRALGLAFAGADVWAPPPQTCSTSSFTSPSPTPTGASPALVG